MGRKQHNIVVGNQPPPQQTVRTLKQGDYGRLIVKAGNSNEHLNGLLILRLRNNDVADLSDGHTWYDNQVVLGMQVEKIPDGTAINITVVDDK